MGHIKSEKGKGVDPFAPEVSLKESCRSQWQQIITIRIFLTNI